MADTILITIPNPITPTVRNGDTVDVTISLTGIADAYTTTVSDARFAPIAKGVDNGNSHDHNGGDGAQISHANLSNIGTNSHSTIDSHIANTSNPHGVTASQAGALPASEYTANDVLSKVKTVDGADSGLDADLLDGQHGAYYAPLSSLVTDHGALSGLSDDDHSQYHNDVRGDARYSQTTHNHDLVYAAIGNGVTNGDSHNHVGGDGGTISYDNLSDKPTIISDHTQLSNIGTNAHSAIDSHLSSTNNPHSVSASQVGAVATGDYEDSDVLAKIKNVDGVSSGLDADLLDGSHASDFSKLASDQSFTGTNKFGTATDYVQISKTDGHMTFVGNARPWRDESSDAINLQQTGSGISRNASEASVEYLTAANQADYIYFNVQLNHDKDLTSSIYPHIHWWQAQNNIPFWLFQYRWQINGAAKITAWTNLACRTAAFTYTSGTLNQICYSNPITVPVGTAISDVVQFRLVRDTTNSSTLFTGSDPYTATASVTNVDVHFLINSIGSNDEYVK